jgi:endonuclease YncB( thermonuclease family)
VANAIRILATLIFAIAAAQVCIRAARAQAFEGAIITGKGTAKDGDSVLVGAGKSTIDVRLHGIDAPEREQECKDEHGKSWAWGAHKPRMLLESHQLKRNSHHGVQNEATFD